METTRRVFLHRLTQLALAVVGLFSPLHGRAQAQTSWRIRRARATDAADLVAIFNAHLTAGLCPYGDQIEPWTIASAVEFLEVHNGTLILEHNRVPVGFAGLLDYTEPTRAQWAAADAEAEIRVFALSFDRLDASEVLQAAKTLGAAVGRELMRMGLSRCRARIRTQPMFDSWYEAHMEVTGIRARDGAAHALEVSFDISRGVAELAAQGY